jgi:hypothetical protein
VSPAEGVAGAPAAPADVASKTLATWLAVVGGSLGLHHFYLRGARTVAGWLYPLPTLLGLVGVLRMREHGVDDRLSWLLIPWLGLTISAGMLCAIVIGLTSDAAWARRHAAAGEAPTPAGNAGNDGDDEGEPAGLVHTGWGPVLGVILALMIGGGVLMGTIAFSVQKWFEWSAP